MNARYVIKKWSAIKWKPKHNTLSAQFQNPIEQIVKRDKIDTPYTQIHVRSHSWHNTDTLFKKKVTGMFKLVLRVQAQM